MADQVTTSLAQAKVLVMQGMKGEDGKSLRVNSVGHVEYWDDEADQWVDTGIEVEGAPGPQGPKGDTGATGADGVSPAVTITSITGGHRVTVTDYQGSESFDVLDGVDGTVTYQLEDDGETLYIKNLVDIPSAESEAF